MIICSAELASFLHFALAKRATIAKLTDMKNSRQTANFRNAHVLDNFWYEAQPVALIHCEFWIQPDCYWLSINFFPNSLNYK